MVSVIVPVYDVEQYLVRCLDSIVGQTYHDLEILLVDDGSNDNSGEICDRYAETDSRIQVFHTMNHGLSAARNVGIAHAAGEYIGFVDSDDWIEPDMYEALLAEAVLTGADVVECGIYREYPDCVIEEKTIGARYTGEEAVRELPRKKYSNAVWNKLWKCTCFDHIRFIERRIFEDVAITYRLLFSAEKVAVIPQCKYHYCYRESGLSVKCDMDSLIGLWLSLKERYEFLDGKIDSNANGENLRLCAKAVAKTWARYYDCDAKDRGAHKKELREMNAFVRRKLPLCGNPGWGWKLRLGVLLSHFCNRLSLGLSWGLLKLYLGAYRIKNGISKCARADMQIMKRMIGNVYENKRKKR